LLTREKIKVKIPVLLPATTGQWRKQPPRVSVNETYEEEIP
jgi:hypothetical protein